MSNSPVYRTRAWRNVRAFILERDARLCQIKLAGCTLVATEADHIVPVAHGGAWYDPNNLRAACKPCNVARGNKTRRDAAYVAEHVGPSREW